MKTFGCVLIVLFVVNMISGEFREKKDEEKIVRCGMTIYYTHMNYCIDYFAALGKRNVETSEGFQIQPIPWLRRYKANSFLKQKKKKTIRDLFAKNYKRFDVDAREISERKDNINEECCREGCFYEEIKEYPCN